jgi:hypothetical protein
VLTPLRLSKALSSIKNQTPDVSAFGCWVLYFGPPIFLSFFNHHQIITQQSYHRIRVP